MKKICLLFIVCISCIKAFTQDELPFAKKGILILLSAKDYAAAKHTAQQASVKLSLKLDLRGLVPDKKTGLTYSAKECENEGGFPCYIARGRYDDGAFISIEYSDAFEGFKKGYYMVVAASGDTTITRPALLQAKKNYPDAYVKTANVYMGCMH